MKVAHGLYIRSMRKWLPVEYICLNDDEAKVLERRDRDLLTIAHLEGEYPVVSNAYAVAGKFDDFTVDANTSAKFWCQDGAGEWSQVKRFSVTEGKGRLSVSFFSSLTHDCPVATI